MTNSTDKWRAHVEAHKFQGPTIKLLEVEPNIFAVLDHEYNLVVVVPTVELPFICNTAFPHPPQRERPKPYIQMEVVLNNPHINLIEVGDLDL